MTQIRKLILTALFIALAIAGGLALIQFPNIEMVTIAVFLGGFFLGAARGLFVGSAAEFLYSFFNPYGVAAPPLLATQVFSMALAGAAGGWLAKLYPARTPPFWLAGLCGFVCTLIFDLNTTLGFTLFIDGSWSGMLAALAIGAPFYLTHIGTNSLIFCLLLPILIPRLRNLTIFKNLSTADQTYHREDSAFISALPAQPSSQLQFDRANSDRR